MAITQRKRRLRNTAIPRPDGSYDMDAVLNRELYPAINSIDELVKGAEGSIVQTRGGEMIWYPPGGTGSLFQTFSDGLPTWTTGLPIDQNRSLIWNPTTQQWAADNHSIRPILIDTHASAPNILLSFTLKNLNDTSGNGLNATVEAGTERYTYITPTLGAFRFDGATVLTVAGSQSLLALTGPATGAAIVIATTRAAQQFIMGYEDLQELEVDNTLWSIFYETTGGVTFISEHGAGINDTVPVNSYFELGQVSLIGFSRYADGSVQHWLNRGAWGSLSAPLATPTGGSNARFRLGGREAATSCFTGTMCSFALWPVSFTETEWISLYNKTLGPWAGFVES